MLVELQQGVVDYLAGRFPLLSVSRAYSPRVSMVEMQQNTDSGIIRVVVAPPTQTGEDVPISRGLIKRTVGVDVGIIIKPNSWGYEEVDPYLETAEEVRRAIWSIEPLPLSSTGYSPAKFVRLEDQFCGVPEDHSRLFAAIFTPYFHVACRF